MTNAAKIKRLRLEDRSKTESLAHRLALVLRVGDVVFLRGELGAGKSTFARAVIRALTTPEEEAPSPTFTLVQTYPTAQFDLWHLDLYRLSDSEEVYELDIEDAFHHAVTLIEWPERLGDLAPATRLELEFALETRKDGEAHESSARLLVATGFGTWQDRLSFIDEGTAK